jgi:hypothetical protein
VDPVPHPLLLRKSGKAGNRIRYLWVSSQEPWSLDHRSGLVGPLQLARACSNNSSWRRIACNSMRQATEFSQSILSSSVLWWRFQTAEVPYPLGSRTVSMPWVQQFSANSSVATILWGRLAQGWISPRHSWIRSLHKLNCGERKWNPVQKLSTF